MTARQLAPVLPLAGRVILVTRAREQAGRFAASLEQAGARVLLAPTIVIEPPESWAPLDAALARATEYRWAIFTSVNGVDMVRRRLEQQGRGAETLGRCRVAAIGPATAEALAGWGLAAEVVPAEYVAEGLAAQLRPLIRRHDRVLLPRAAETRDVLVRELVAMGAVVDEVAAYRTRPATEAAAALRDALQRHEVDVVTFTSSSTVRNFAALWAPGELGPLMAGVTVACIGPITRRSAAALGLRAEIMPDEYTIPALTRAIIAHFSRQPDEEHRRT
jgi:uroporphyrinogen III methyltransferase/synthase